MKSQNAWYFKVHLNSTAVLFLHPFPANSEIWEPQLQLLREMKIPSLLFDYPGFGKSSPPEMKMEIDDYAHAIRAMLEQNGIEKVIPVGLSMGGYVALALYRLYPKLFSGLVLADTKIFADSVTVHENRMKMIRDLSGKSNREKLRPLFDSHLQYFFTEQTRKKRPELLRKMETIFSTVTVKGVIEAQRAMACRPDASEMVQKMDVPVLCLAGKDDPLTPVADIRQMAGYFPEASTEIIPDAAHLSNLENPEIFNKHFKNYLKTVLG